jgi:hypothetical protein
MAERFYAWLRHKVWWIGYRISSWATALSFRRGIKWPARIIHALYRARRWIQGARRVDCNEPSVGQVIDDGVEIEFGGACPVQGFGIVDGLHCYYRSRGEGWQFHIAATYDDLIGNDIWSYEERKYAFPDGGWVSAHVSEACIRKAVKLWRESRHG